MSFDEAAASNLRAEVRGTQSFVGTMQHVWLRPSLTAIEILWRWMYGAFALTLLWHFGERIWMAARNGTGDAASVGLGGLTIANPLVAADKLGEAFVMLAPALWSVARWLAPLLVVLWIVMSAVGRSIVLRRLDAKLRPQITTQIFLAAMRTAALCAVLLVWVGGLLKASALAVSGPIARQQEPSFVLYAALVIVGTLALFSAWSAMSWVLSIAPLLAALRGLGAAASVRAAFRLGPLRGKLVEINLVMGIVKIALIVLAMVFSACPLPFEAVATQSFLVWWWIGVTLVYFIASDFFHVVRLAGYLELWQAYEVT